MRAEMITRMMIMMMIVSCKSPNVKLNVPFQKKAKVNVCTCVWMQMQMQICSCVTLWMVFLNYPAASGRISLRTSIWTTSSFVLRSRSMRRSSAPRMYLTLLSTVSFARVASSSCRCLRPRTATPCPISSRRGTAQNMDINRWFYPQQLNHCFSCTFAITVHVMLSEC